ncbi:MAG: hypothetical protein WCK02_12435 [Bacteroidota bacterium]
MTSLLLNSEYSMYWLVLCVFFGILVASILYFKNYALNVSKRLNIVLWFIRFLTITIISFLLLNPFIKTTNKEVESPVIAVGIDNSESIYLSTADSNAKIKEINQKIDSLTGGLSKKFDVKLFAFGQENAKFNKLTFSDKLTDISSFFQNTNTIYAGRNLGAMVLFSDGLYNKGINPLYTSGKINKPVFTVLMGDTTVNKDLAVKDISFNKICFAGNIFPLEIFVQAKKAKGSLVNLSIEENGIKIQEKQIQISSNDYYQMHSFQVKTQKPGTQKYTIRISKAEGEKIIVNNSKTIYVDVLDGKQKVLLLYESPHPDLGAIKKSLEQNQNYEVTSEQYSESKASFGKYNLVLMHQLPTATSQSLQVVKQVIQSNVPMLFVIGEHTSVSSLNSLKLGLNIIAKKVSMSDAQGFIDKNFSSFTINDKLINFLPKLPPLQVLFGSYNVSENSNVLAYQKIGAVETNMPLIMFANNDDSKVGFICGEGIWRWRILNYAQMNNSEMFDELVSKIVQYLAVKVDKSLFKIKTEPKCYENEQVVFDAELYNDSYELINEPEITLEVISSDNKKFEFGFSKTFNAYRLNAGQLKPDDYSYIAKTKVNNKMLEAKGKFTVMKLDVESSNLTADAQLMYNIAAKSKGKMYYSNNIKNLIEDINNREELKDVAYTRKKTEDIINLKWLFFLILGFLSVEWFIRKFNGSY